MIWDTSLSRFNTLRQRQNGHRFADYSSQCVLLIENICITMNIWFTFVLKGLSNNIPASVPIMAFRRPGDKPLFEAMMVRLPKHVCVNWPQWDNITPIPLTAVAYEKCSRGAELSNIASMENKIDQTFGWVEWIFIGNNKFQIIINSFSVLSLLCCRQDHIRVLNHPYSCDVCRWRSLICGRHIRRFLPGSNFRQKHWATFDW